MNLPRMNQKFFNFVPKKPTMNDIPKGRTKDDIKVREKLIKDFYAHWISEHPAKRFGTTT